MNIYIGNLSYDTQESDLNTLFSEYGPVESVKIISDRMTGRSKGFGFIEMADDAAAKKAIAELDQKEYMDRTLKVNEAKPRPPKRENSW